MGGTQLRSFFKPSSVLILSRQVFAYKMFGILTLFCLNARNFYFSIKNHICSTTAQNFTGIKRLRIFWYIGLSPTQTPTQKLKNGFSVFSSEEIASLKMVLLKMLFHAVQLERFRIKFNSLNKNAYKFRNSTYA